MGARHGVGKMALTYFKPELRILFCAEYRSLTWNLSNLSAPHWRFYWNARNASRLFFKTRTVELDDQRYLLIPPNTDFRTESPRLIDHFFIHFLVKPPYDKIGAEVFEIPRKASFDEKIQEIRGLLESRFKPDLRLSMLCHALCSEALLIVPENLLEKCFFDPRIDRVVKLMEERLGLGVSNAELARSAGMNANAFTRLFREKIGMTPQRYLRKLQVEHACVSLQFTRQSLEEIAENAGFCDRYHFTRVFKKLRGTTPAKFRRTAM